MATVKSKKGYKFVETEFPLQARRQGGMMGANAPPPQRGEKVRLERSKDELTNAKDESFLLICQRTQLFTV